MLIVFIILFLIIFSSLLLGRRVFKSIRLSIMKYLPINIKNEKIRLPTILPYGKVNSNDSVLSVNQPYHQEKQIKKSDQTVCQTVGNPILQAPEYISKLVASLEEANSRKDMYQILDTAVLKTPQFTCVDDTVFIGNNYKFQCSLNAYTDQLDVEKMKKSSEQQLLKIISIGNSGMSVIVSAIKE